MAGEGAGARRGIGTGMETARIARRCAAFRSAHLLSAKKQYQHLKLFSCASKTNGETET